MQLIPTQQLFDSAEMLPPPVPHCSGIGISENENRNTRLSMSSLGQRKRQTLSAQPNATRSSSRLKSSPSRLLASARLTPSVKKSAAIISRALLSAPVQAKSRLESAWYTPVIDPLIEQETALTEPINVFARSPEMEVYEFFAITVRNTGRGLYIFQKEVLRSFISVATDWQDGLMYEGNDKVLHPAIHNRHWTTGYLGSGGSKYAIYVRASWRIFLVLSSFLIPTQGRLGDEEYAITVPKLVESETHAQNMLTCELVLLLQCHEIKQAWDKYIQERGIDNIPGVYHCTATSLQRINMTETEFYFNYPGAFIGKIHRSTDNTERERGELRYLHFLATKLLPSNFRDGEVVKFSGNNQLGKPDPKNKMELVIHAFTHFSHEYTGHSLILCDLQGVYLYYVSMEKLI